METPLVGRIFDPIRRTDESTKMLRSAIAILLNNVYNIKKRITHRLYFVLLWSLSRLPLQIRIWLVLLTRFLFQFLSRKIFSLSLFHAASNKRHLPFHSPISIYGPLHRTPGRISTSGYPCLQDMQDISTVVLNLVSAIVPPLNISAPVSLLLCL